MHKETRCERRAQHVSAVWKFLFSGCGRRCDCQQEFPHAEANWSVRGRCGLCNGGNVINCLNHKKFWLLTLASCSRDSLSDREAVLLVLHSRGQLDGHSADYHKMMMGHIVAVRVLDMAMNDMTVDNVGAPKIELLRWGVWTAMRALNACECARIWKTLKAIKTNR